MKKNNEFNQILLGGALNEVDQLGKRVAKLESALPKIESLIFWNRLFVALLSFIGVAILRCFWRHPELWKQLVELLK